MLERDHSRRHAIELDLRCFRSLSPLWWLFRRHVGISEIPISSPSDLLATHRRLQVHVVGTGGGLGRPHDHRNHHHDDHWRLVPIRQDVPHQPRQQPGGFLDPFAHCGRADRHHLVHHIRILHQGLPCVLGGRWPLNSRVESSFVSQQRSDSKSSPGIPQSPPCHCPAMEGDDNCPHHYC